MLSFVFNYQFITLIPYFIDQIKYKFLHDDIAKNGHDHRYQKKIWLKSFLFVPSNKRNYNKESQEPEPEHGE